MKTKSLLIFLMSFMVVSLLTGCGGGNGGGGGTTPPSAPDILTRTAAVGQITITWTAVTGATGYEVWYHTANDSSAGVKFTGDTNETDTSCIISGLTNGSTYYVWVKAKNNVGTSGFSSVISGTPASIIYMYATTTLYDGNLKGTMADARTGADAIALANRPPTPNLSGKTVHAFISVSATDCIANMPNTFGFPDNIPIVSANDNTKVIADDWATDLFVGYIDDSLETTLIMPDSDVYYWWSGSDSIGNYDAVNNCNGWTSNLVSVKGKVGRKNTIGSGWINDASITGNNSHYVICIAY